MHSSLEKAFEKQTKTTEDQERKQIRAIDLHGKKQIKAIKELRNNSMQLFNVIIKRKNTLKK